MNYRSISVIILILLLYGCTNSPSNHNKLEPKTNIHQQQSNIDNQAVDKLQNPQVDDIVNKTNLEITPNKAIELLLKSIRIYGDLVNGGPDIQSSNNCSYDQVQFDNEYYIYICGADSLSMLSKYLQQAFTEKVSNKIIKDLQIKTYSNKLIIPLMGYSSSLRWEEAGAKLQEQNSDTAKYIFTVPVSEEGDSTTTFSVNYLYVNEMGWRIDSDPASFK